MRTKRKWLLAIAGAVLAPALLVLLAGCSSGGGANEGGERQAEIVTLEFWSPFSGGDNQFMTSLVTAFNREHPDISVTQVNSRLDEYYSRLRTAIMSGNAPDVAVLHQTSLPQFVKNGYIENIAELTAADGLDWNGFREHALHAVMYDGEPYAIPLDTHALVLFYNKDHLEAAGLLGDDDKPVIGPGEEGFLSFLERLRETLPPEVAPLSQPSTRIDSVWLWWSLYNQIEGGGVFYDESSGDAAFDNPNALRALEFVKSLYDRELIPSDINDAFKLFYDGDAAAIITGMWGTGAFERAEALNFGVVPVPVIYDRPAVWGDSHTLAIPKRHTATPAKREAAIAFAKWLAEHGELWAEAGHVPAKIKATQSEAFVGLPYRSDYAEAVNDVAYWPRQPKQWSVIEYVIQEFERMIYGKQSAKASLAAAVKRTNTELRK